MEIPKELEKDFKRLKKEGKQRVKEDDYELLLAYKKPLTDNDFMPYGEHNDKKMINVPASYLCYLWNKGLKEESCALSDYIRDALPILRLEYKSGNWNEV